MLLLRIGGIMKHKILIMAATLGALFSLAVAAGAQTRNQVKVRIGFDFVAGESKLEAGDYSVKRLSQNAILLRSADGKSKAIVLVPITLSRRREDAPERLVFKRYGSEYLLVEVWTDRQNDGRALDTVKTEKRLAKRIKSAPQTVEVLAKQN